MLPTRFLARSLRIALVLGMTATALSACASTSGPGPDYAGLSRGDASQAMAEMAARYRTNPRDKANVIYYAAALRGQGLSQQAVAVLETGMSLFPGDPDIRVAYAKALTADGRFEQALSVIDGTIRPDAPGWNALLVKGAVLDQMGRNDEARQYYAQALIMAPGEASIEANYGLSYAMTNDLGSAEQHLRRAVSMPGANTKIRQNLALVLGLQGRFDECRAIYAAELPPEQVDANMAYVRALLTQQNRWDAIERG